VKPLPHWFAGDPPFPGWLTRTPPGPITLQTPACCPSILQVYFCGSVAPNVVHRAFPVFEPDETEHAPPLAVVTEQLAVPLSGGAPVVIAEHWLPYTGLFPCGPVEAEVTEQKPPPPSVEQIEVELPATVWPALQD
jgi:hypothetical protein